MVYVFHPGFTCKSGGRGYVLLGGGKVVVGDGVIPFCLYEHTLKVGMTSLLWSSVRIGMEKKMMMG